MSTLRLWQIDAFTDRVFAGNPAAVVPLEAWLPDDRLQAIAAENNLSETAFLVPDGEDYRLRWFTPGTEVDLCGHATLATAWVLFNRLGRTDSRIVFHTLSGALTVTRRGEALELDFPARPPLPCPVPVGLAEALGAKPVELHAARDYMCVLPDEAAVKALKPDMAAVARLDKFAVIVTAPAAPGRGVDFVSRFFAPAKGVPEDPVTGSSHCTLVPYWSGRLGKTTLAAEQVSPRGGRLDCRLDGNRVFLAGRCAPYMVGEIEVPV